MGPIIDLIRNHPEQINALAAISALFVSSISIFLTVRALSLQRQHNYKSLTPIANLLYGDYENALEVTLKNAGIGPLIIEQVIVSRGGEERNNIIGWMPDFSYSTFVSKFENRCLSPDQEIVLLRFEGSDTDANFIRERDEVRKSLSELHVLVKYKDIYDRRMKDESRDLDWFARRLPKIEAAPAAKSIPSNSASPVQP